MPTNTNNSSQPTLSDDWGNGSIQSLHERMKAWVSGVLGDVPTSHDSPANMTSTGRCVNLFLFGIAPSLSAHSGAKIAPLQLTVQFIVTAWGPDTVQVSDDLCSLSFAAMESPVFDVSFDPLPVATWAAFGIAPRLAFTIRLPVRKERSQPSAGIVRTPLVVVHSAMVSLKGAVLGPADVPISGARVELPSLGLATQTDSKGQFRFVGVPANGALRFRVRARGSQQEFALQEDPRDPAQVLQLRMDL